MKRDFPLILILFAALFITDCKHSTNNQTVYNDYLKVETTNTGFFISQTAPQEYTQFVITVFDEMDQVFNVQINATRDNERKYYAYPFVTEGKQYTIRLKMWKVKNGEWYDYIESDPLSLKASGGRGDYRISHNGFSYDGNDTVSAINYKIIRPNDIQEPSFGYGVVYYTNNPPAHNSQWDWNQNWDYLQSIDSDIGKAVLNNQAKGTLSQEGNFWIRLCHSIWIDNVNYEYWIEKDDTYFVYNKKTDILSSDDGILSVQITNNGFKITKNHNPNYKNIRINVRNNTINKDMPAICADENTNTLYYPFTKAGDSYTVYARLWDGNWANMTTTSSITFTAEGGHGNSYVTYDSYTYYDKEDKVCQIRYKNYDFIIPGEYANIRHYGTIYRDDGSETWTDYPFNNGVLDISSKYSFVRHHSFFIGHNFSFRYGDNDFEVYVIYNEHDKFTDNHSLPSKVLTNAFTEIEDFGEYTVSAAMSGKKAFLIKYNAESKWNGDNALVISGFDASTSDSFNCQVQIIEENLGELISSSETISGARAVTSDNYFDYSGYKEGVTTKNFGGYNSVLKAAGEHCNIWFCNNTPGSSLEKDIENLIHNGDFSYKAIANEFDKIYEIETYIFGSNVPTRQFSNCIKVPANNKIDILFYDMDNDYVSPSNVGGQWGYFSPNDKYLKSANSYSWESQMLHIDSGHIVNARLNMINVILHEFQHLLTDVVKTINYGCGYDYDYTERMSLAAEDVLQTHILQGYYENEMMRDRMPGFNGGYFGGITNWGAIGSTNFSYGTNAAFIDFIMKNYGGVETLRDIAHANVAGTDSVINTLRSKGYNETLDSLMLKFAVCIINGGKSEANAVNGLTAMKKTSCTLNIYGKNTRFELNPLNYYDYYVSYPSRTSRYDRYDTNIGGQNNYGYNGPAILAPGKTFDGVILPNSFTINYIGQNLNTLTFNYPGDNIILAVVFTD